MDTKYKSSSFATYSQYIASPLIVAIFIYQLSVYLKTGGGTENMPSFFLPFWFWASIIVVINMIKLRYIKVTENNILVESLGGNEEVLEYKDIEWINQNIFGSNWYILSIKYKDVKTGKSKTIFAFPEMYSSRERITVFGELNITQYIREQIIKVNPSYRKENEPSRWYLAKWIFGSLIPFVLISIIFFT